MWKYIGIEDHENFGYQFHSQNLGSTQRSVVRALVVKLSQSSPRRTAKMSLCRKVAIFATHPIQYHIPWYQKLSREEGVKVKVYYSAILDPAQQGKGFGVDFQWDIPLFEGYEWEVLPNWRASPDLSGFFSSIPRNIIRILKRDKPDVVVLTGWQQWPLLHVLFASALLRIPRIVRGESNAMKPRQVWVKIVHRLLLTAYDAFLAIGISSREFYIQYGIKNELIFPCRYFVDNERFEAGAARLEGRLAELREQWFIPQEKACFLFSGKLIEKKRIFDVIEALNYVVAEESNVHLLVVGVGELLDQAKSLVRKYDLPVTFAGFLNQSEVISAYAVADCLVLPSDYGETWGLVVNEAMACGKPAIVSDRVGCAPDLVENDITGYQYPFGDTRSLADKMLRIVSDRSKTDVMGRNARQRVLSRYSVDKAVKGTLRAIDSVLGDL